MTSNDNPPLKVLAGFPKGLVSYDDIASFLTVPVEWTDFNDLSTEEFETAAPDFDIAVGLAGLLQPDNVSLMTGLRAVISGTVGYSQMERSSMPPGCDFALIFGHEYPIADWVMLSMLALSRDTLRIDRGFRDTTIPSALEHGIAKDLYESTVAVLNFAIDVMPHGSILAFDDWHCFRSDENRGEQRAFQEFCRDHPDLKFSEFLSFGWHGKSFLVHRQSS